MKDLIEIKQVLDDITTIYIEFLCDLLELNQFERINLIGIGNSISAGWTAVDNNVQPLVEKLHEFVDKKCEQAHIDFNLASFSIAGKNSNEEIYKFLISNPSLEDVKKHFEKIFDYWKKEFNGTMLENRIDKEVALSYYYSDSKTKFSDFYDKDSLTITSFNGCTGEFLNNPTENLIGIIKNQWTFLNKELNYLERIITYLENKTEYSFITVGNFPYITRKWLPLKGTIDKINEQIEKTTAQHSKSMYFNGIKLDLVNIVDGRIKVDNHPNLLLQYRSLCDYLLFLMERIPERLNQTEILYKKYKPKIEEINRSLNNQ